MDATATEPGSEPGTDLEEASRVLAALANCAFVRARLARRYPAFAAELRQIETTVSAELAGPEP